MSLTKKNRMREMTTLTLHSMRDNKDQLERGKKNPQILLREKGGGGGGGWCRLRSERYRGLLLLLNGIYPLEIP